MSAPPVLPPIQREAHERLVAEAVADALRSLRARMTGYMRTAGKSWNEHTAPEMVARGEVQRCINLVNEALADGDCSGIMHLT